MNPTHFWKAGFWPYKLLGTYYSLCMQVVNWNQLVCLYVFHVFINCSEETGRRGYLGLSGASRSFGVDVKGTRISSGISFSWPHTLQKTACVVLPLNPHPSSFSKPWSRLRDASDPVPKSECRHDISTDREVLIVYFGRTPLNSCFHSK